MRNVQLVLTLTSKDQSSSFIRNKIQFAILPEIRKALSLAGIDVSPGFGLSVQTDKVPSADKLFEEPAPVIPIVRARDRMLQEREQAQAQAQAQAQVQAPVAETAAPAPEPAQPVEVSVAPLPISPVVLGPVRDVTITLAQEETPAPVKRKRPSARAKPAATKATATKTAKPAATKKVAKKATKKSTKALES